MIASHFENADSRRPQPECLRAFLWSSLFVGLLFAAVSFLSAAVPGVNEPHYLTKARAFDDSTWCRRDFFLTSANAHYCFFQIIGPLTRVLSLDAVAIVGRLMSAILLGMGWGLLRRSLGLSATWGYIAAGIFALLSLMGSFSGEWLLGGFESKVPSWGLALAALGLWITGESRNRSVWTLMAGVSCGLSCAIHPVVGGWVAICICLASLMILLQAAFRKAIRKFTLRQLRRQQQSEPAQQTAYSDTDSASGLEGVPRAAACAIRLMCFALATLVVSLPGLLPALRLLTTSDLPKKELELASFYQVFWRLKHHLDPTELTASQWQFAFCMLVILVCGMKAWNQLQRRRHEKAQDAPGSQYEVSGPVSFPVRCLLLFFMMSALIAFAGVLIGWHNVPAKEMADWEWRAALLKFYPFRCFDAMLPVTAALVIARLGEEFPAIRDERTNRRLRRGILLTVTGSALALSLATRESVPAGYDSEQFQEWRIACDWIRNNTAEDALFLTPRESFAFKWFAERAEYVCYKDCPQDAGGILTWNRRLWQLHDWTLKSSSDQIYGANDLKELRRITDCDYVVTRILGPFESPPAWEGRIWRIYAVPARD